MSDGRDASAVVSGRRKRADAERNIAAILDAAVGCFAVNPFASMTDIAKAAGVGRVTLYAHFPSREDVIDAAITRAIAITSTRLDGIDIDSTPAAEALPQVVRSSWEMVDRFRGLYSVVTRELDAEILRRHHDPLHDRLTALISRGRQEGAFRRDLPVSWLVAAVYNLMHGAAEEVQSGRLRADEAGDVLAATISSVLRE